MVVVVLEEMLVAMVDQVAVDSFMLDKVDLQFRQSIFHQLLLAQQIQLLGV